MEMKKLLTAFGICVLCVGGLARLDRYFFKNNDSFSIRFIHSTLSYNPDWETPHLSPEEKSAVDKILDQKFYYLDKGGQSFAFVSADGNYVLKFCKFPSALRPLSWLSHTFSKWKPSRIQEAKKSRKKLHNAFHSFKLAYEELKEETGLIYLHLNASHDFKKNVTIVDKLGSHYQVSLDKVSFLLQKKARLIYSVLDDYKAKNNHASAKAAIGQLIHLVASCGKKGIVDYDAILRKNYGFLNDRAIHIDLGEFARNNDVKHPERLKAHVLEMTGSLRTRLEKFYPEFLPYYDQEIETYFPLHKIEG